MDQRSSTVVDDLLMRSRHALQAGHFAVALDYASRARTISPYHPGVKQAIEECLMRRGPHSPEAPPAPAARMVIPPGQEPRPQPRSDADPAFARRSTTRPDDATGRWNMGLRAQTAPPPAPPPAIAQSSRAPQPPSKPFQSGLHASRVPPAPFVPGPERRSQSAPAAPAPFDDSRPGPASAIVRSAVSRVGQFATLLHAAAAALLAQAVVRSRRLTVRGVLLAGAYCACASYSVYAAMTATRVFQITVFPAAVAPNDGPKNLTPDASNAPLRNRAALASSAPTPASQTAAASAAPPTASIQALQETRPAQPSGNPAPRPTPTPITTELPTLAPTIKKGEAKPLPPEAAPAPATPRQIIESAEALLNAQQHAQAVALLEEHASNVPSVSRATVQATLARALDLHGAALFAQGEVTAAIDAHRRAAKIAPAKPEYQLHLGNALYHHALTLKKQGAESLSTLKEAAAAVEVAVKHDPTNYHAHHRLAMIYELLKRPNDARRAWERTLKHAPPASKSANAADSALKRIPRRT